jgi:hypothetical protein
MAGLNVLTNLAACRDGCGRNSGEPARSQPGSRCPPASDTAQPGNLIDIPG